MGCMASKLEYEDAVTRCKDRRRHMKEAIYAHRHLVTAHSNYVCSLPVIGSALSDFAGDAVKEYFDKAASAGEKVSEMLETGRAQLDRSRSQLTGTLSHSSGVSSNLSSQPSLIDEQGGTKSLCSTLEWLLAWEEELKARDGMKIGKEKNMERLQVSSGMEKRIFRCIINGTWSALVPQLAELCHRSMNMWKSLNEFAEVQNHVPQLRGQVNRSANGKSTSNLDPKSIDRLQSALSNWHGSFCRRTKFEREFIHSLHAWFQLLPPNAELPHPTTVLSDVVGLFDKWMIFHDSQLAKDAPRAIKNFNSLVQNISRTQTEQLKKPKKIDKKSKLAACQREVKEEMLRRTEEEEKTRMNDILMGSLTVLQTLSNNFYGSIVQALETVCKQYDNARGVPEESGSDVEAHGGGGGGGGGGESYNNNAEGVPEESGIGDAEAHGGGGGGGGESDNSNSEGSQRRVEEEMLRHMKEETATLTNMMALLERIAEEVVLRQRSRLRRRH